MLRVVLTLLAGLAAGGCGVGAGGRPRGGPPEVVVTTTQLADVVRNVGGDRVDVHQILRANTDPHEYEPRPKDVVATAGAALVVESGDGLDAWMDRVVRESGGHPALLVAGDHVRVRLPGPASGSEAYDPDPHWWHDPRNVEAVVPVVRDALERVAPTAKAEIARRARRYVSRLRTLDAGIARCMAAVPAARRKLVTSHDAFAYFARRYKITVIGAVIPSRTTEAQPSAGAIRRLAAVVRREHVRAIFPEASVNPKLAEALARETGAVANLTLYGDTLGPPGSPGATYLGMERANADAMVQGFTGGHERCRTRVP